MYLFSISNRNNKKREHACSCEQSYENWWENVIADIISYVYMKSVGVGAWFLSEHVQEV